MQFIVKILGSLAILSVSFDLCAQTVHLPHGSKHSAVIDRIEILLQKDSLLNVSTAKPYSRRMIVEVAEKALSNPDLVTRFSSIDRYNLQSLLMNNSEWVTGDKEGFRSRRPLFNTFYKTKANFLEVDNKDFFLAVNPVLQVNLARESENDELLFLNARGITVRGMIARRLGFYTSVIENLERAPRFVQDRVSLHRAVPGGGRYNIFRNTGWDYSDARGGITFNAAKFIDIQFAYDRNFIGNGYRSLFLSDFGSNYLFLKLNTRIWKLNYQNIFMELSPTFSQFVRDNDILLPKKYAAMHHLSINATKWLNLGLFEAVIFGRTDHFDFMYLNPIMFLRTAEKQNNSPDNGFVGFDAKANIGRSFKLYGQLLFDELLIKELKAGNGWWGNKFGVQLGGKYVNAFRIDNLDLQAELNLARPYMYSFKDSTSNYSHYNQQLAHPLGANFVEFVGRIRYQPVPRLTTEARLIAFKQGIDTGSANYGSNIFKTYTSRVSEYGVSLPFGVSSNGVNLNLSASYEVKENFFVDATLLVRRYKVENDIAPVRNSSVIGAGIRWNMSKREHDY